MPSKVWPFKSLKDIRGEVWPEELDLIAPKLLVPGGKMLIYGFSKTGKSLLVQQLAYCLTAGVPWIGYDVARPLTVAYVQKEISHREMYNRTRAMDRAYADVLLDPEKMFVSTTWGYTLDSLANFKSLAEALKERRVDVVILDPLFLFLGGDPSDDDKTNEFLGRMTWLGGETQAAEVMVHHSRKGLTGMMGGEGMADFSEAKGSTSWIQWPDTVAKLVKTSAKKRTVQWQAVRHGAEPPDQELFFDVETLTFGTLTKSPAPVIMQVLKAGPMGLHELHLKVEEETGYSRSQVDRARKMLENKGMISKTRDPDDKKSFIVEAS
mgnify:CR=1 FL=1